MARIPLTGGFTLIPEGTHIFRIYKVDYDANFGKLVVHLVNADGITHMERFGLMKQDGTMNEGACNAFSFFAKNALNNFAVSEIDHNDLVDCYIKADIAHTTSPSTKEEGKTVTFANSSNYAPASGFERTACEKARTLGKVTATPTNATATPAPQSSNVDLASLLG